ncbi:unnamed protein product [Lupinus luteus]|uniref:Uncharacterized protein n=1 Tax=Lupinus luteus TaxID=3873 RepID=A0AAV1XC80_LUPLU
MKSLSSIGLGLSIVFGCLLLALVAEIYYLLWWKKRIISNRDKSDYGNPMKELFYMFCWKRTSTRRNTTCFTSQHVHEEREVESSQNSKEFIFKPFGEDIDGEFMLGPPRFLFTIVEESKEDLESEDGKSRNCSKEFNGMKSSPPPKFKFLQEAEEKLRRKLQKVDDEVGDASYINIVVDKKSETNLTMSYVSQLKSS